MAETEAVAGDDVHFDQRGFVRVLVRFVFVVLGATIGTTVYLTDSGWSTGLPIAVGLVLVSSVPVALFERWRFTRRPSGLWISETGIRVEVPGLSGVFGWGAVGPIVSRRYVMCLYRRTSMIEVDRAGAKRYVPILWFGSDFAIDVATELELRRPTGPG